MKDLLPIIFSNIYGFDILIFVAALINLTVYFYSIHRATKLYDVLHPTAKAVNPLLNEARIVEMRKSAASAYSMFVNITSIFPLLGILGTVLSLLNMAQDLTNVQNNFFGALTSTFWGLIFAIMYKLIDGRLSSIIEDNEKTVAFYLERSSSIMAVEKERACSENVK